MVVDEVLFDSVISAHEPTRKLEQSYGHACPQIGFGFTFLVPACLSSRVQNPKSRKMVVVVVCFAFFFHFFTVAKLTVL